MSKSISFQHGTKLSREHNIRNAKYIKNQEHIDKGRIDQNIIFIDEKLQDAYEEIFGESFREYNSKLRKDRQCKNYYDKIKNDSQKHLVYECIVQIGNEEDTGYTSELEQQALIQFFMEWKERNPHLKLVGAYMHNDEATSHLHLDYIPVATECKRGMKTQNSLTKALQQQGFNGKSVKDTEQIQWQNSERKALENICQSMNIDAKANQGLCKIEYYDERTGTVKTVTRKHLSTPDFKAYKQKISKLQQENSELQEKKTTAEKEVQSLEEKSRDLKKEVEELQEKIMQYEPPKKNLMESNKAYEERSKTYQELQLIKEKEISQQRLQAELTAREQAVHQSEMEYERKKKAFNEELQQAYDRGYSVGYDTGKSRGQAEQQKEDKAKISELENKVDQINNNWIKFENIVDEYLQEEFDKSLDDVIDYQNQKNIERY